MKKLMFIALGIILFVTNVGAFNTGILSQIKGDNRKVYNHAQNIQQFITNNNYNIPPMIEKEVQSIEMASGPTVTIKFK